MRLPVVPVIIALNIVVFIMWTMYGQSQFMLENFLISWSALAAGRWWTLLTSEFSHLWFVHIFLNMLVLLSFGPIVEYTIGSGRFLRFYLVAAVIASLSHAAVSNFLLLHQPELPASAHRVRSQASCCCLRCLYPRARIFLFGLIPMPALVGALAFVGLDAVGLFAQTEGSGLPIGHGAHLGGAATGVLYYLLIIRPLRLQRSGPVDFGDVATWRALMRRQPPPEFERKPR